MLKSMTGFGRGEYLDDLHRFVVEIKTINHRYNEIVIRMPKQLNPLEDKIRRSISALLCRGRIDVYISMEEYSQKKRIVRVDKELAIAYHSALRELAELFAESANSEIFAHQIAKYPDVINVDELSEDVVSLWPKLSEAIGAALDNVLVMRSTEGEIIEKDLLARMDKLEGYIDSVEEYVPQMLAEYREKFVIRIKEVLSDLGAELDENRAFQEMAIYADRVNFTEELVRFRSHLTQFRTTLKRNEAVGRKLDFIVQEINREVNTIASKANDFAVSTIMVEIKSELEKIREQIQNIE